MGSTVFKRINVLITAFIIILLHCTQGNKESETVLRGLGGVIMATDDSFTSSLPSDRN